MGVVGRWCRHLHSGGGGDTFSQRFVDIEPDRLEELRDLTVVYWVLGQQFATSENSCRRGVEYLVQRRLIETTGVELLPALRLIANVRSNPTVNLKFVQATARYICEEFTDVYMSQGVVREDIFIS